MIKKSTAKPILLAMVLVLCAWFLTAGAVYGASMFQKMMTASANIIKDADFKFYSDAQATQEISNIALGDITAGKTSTFTIYLKNTSTATELISSGSIAVPSTVGTLTMTFDGQPQISLPPGGVTKVVGTLNVVDSANAGPINFNFFVQALPLTSGATTTPPTGTTSTTTVPPTTVALNGQQIFAANCITCHSSPPNTTRTQSQLVSFISGHQSGTTLTAAQVTAVAAYIKP